MQVLRKVSYRRMQRGNRTSNGKVRLPENITWAILPDHISFDRCFFLPFHFLSLPGSSHVLHTLSPGSFLNRAIGYILRASRPHSLQSPLSISTHQSQNGVLGNQVLSSMDKTQGTHVPWSMGPTQSSPRQREHCPPSSWNPAAALGCS